MTEKIHPSAAQTSAAQNGTEQNLSRRRFLNTAGTAAVGGLMVAAGTTLFGNTQAQAEDPPAAPPLPWKYVELDPLEAGKRGYKAYLEQGG
jgi:hypothetical protein